MYGMNNFKEFNGKDWLWFATSSSLYGLFVIVAFTLVATGFEFIGCLVALAAVPCAYVMVYTHDIGADELKTKLQEYVDDGTG
jgi:hypothetical protein